MAESSISTPRILTTTIPKNSAVSTPRILTTAIIKKSSISTPRILCTVVPSTNKAYYYDTSVKTTKDITQNHDTAVRVRQDISQNHDTNLKATADLVKYLDTYTITKTDISIYCDVALELQAKDLQAYFYDTALKINEIVQHSYDTAINTKADISRYYDTAIATKADISRYYDTVLNIVERQEITYYCDTRIKTDKLITTHSDTAVSIPHNTTIQPDNTPTNPFEPSPQAEKSGVVSISINLNELSLSDSFSMETTQNINVLDTISGKILDFPYMYKVSETQQQEAVTTAKGMYDVDEILYKSINYAAGNQTHTLQEHAQYIAGALGKSLVFCCDNFTHSGKWTGDGQTYNSIISSLFGWSASIPHRAINVFLRAKDNSLNVIQRGQENKVTDISKTAYTRPVINRTLERTMINYSSSTSNGHDQGWGLYIEPLPFWGSLTFGDSVCSYESGYLRSEQNQDGTTSYDYVGDGFGEAKYLSRKTIQHSDGSVTVTTYNYEHAKSGVLVLGSETETTTDKDGNETVRKTIHAPLGAGFYGTSVYIDGEFQGSSISTGSPACTASRYLTSQESLTLGGANYGDSDGNPLGKGNVLKETLDLPTTDEDTIKAYLNQIKWLNRRIKETVSLDIYNFNHILDFSERIKFKNNTYYLQSNQITQTTKELKQSITIVRWL
ncbi:hypothetical protein D081_1800 [Anaerovibrio sp. JC8]|uniref:hypothetical protein n=1 Tax=Anaerovibrio sp. JC8 TaxID=1240085 RepID=UPI000A0B0AD7|nr:hypothetical protein [Anaerovibrio sp. JC8]ORT99650.1 hypothetical protein D081_1800 [Anaerovibrio sp. JC8]